jgi:hypothetical protein
MRWHVTSVVTAVTISSANSPQEVTAELLREIFRERAGARAILGEACVYDLHQAVDGLQYDAQSVGLRKFLCEIAEDKAGFPGHRLAAAKAVLRRDLGKFKRAPANRMARIDL